MVYGKIGIHALDLLTFSPTSRTSPVKNLRLLSSNQVFETHEPEKVEKVNVDKNRRALALALSGASTLPAWKEPLVDSVLLPVHAATSGLGCVQLAEALYANFGSEIFVAAGDSIYSDSGCSELSQQIPQASENLIYTDQGPTAAQSVCDQTFSQNQCGQEDITNPNVWVCADCSI